MKQTDVIWIAISALTWVIAQVEKEPQSSSRDEHLDEKRKALKLLNDMVASMEAFTKVVAFVDPSAPKLVDGKIPPHTECPYKAKCNLVMLGNCGHAGKLHNVPFSCASARAFEILEDMKKDKF